jgi:hypothetical protein
MTMQEADAVPGAIELSSPQTFRKEGTQIAVSIQPRQFADFTGLERADLFVLYMIRDAYPERGLFFSRTTGSYVDEMGFTPFTMVTGLARKLLPTPPTPSDSVVAVQGVGMFDVPTTRALWQTTFRAPHSIARRDLWVDRPSAGIPYLYVRTGMELSAALDHEGRSQEAAKIRGQVGAVARATQLEDLVAVR